MKINEELKKVIESNALSLSSINEKGFPHIIYVMFVKILDNGRLLITDNFMNKTKENILKNPNVSLAVLVGEAGFELVGKAEYFSDGKNLEFVKKIPENKNCPCKGAILFSIEKVTKMA